MNKQKIKTALLFTVILMVTLCMYEEIVFKNVSDSVVRLHVIAASDEEFDQRLKLAVRDRVLSETNRLILNCKSKQEAQQVLNDNLEVLTETAKKCIIDQGYDYDVKAVSGIYFFPTKQYENYTLPAGEYDSVRIIIGEGEGKNWWCVLFPPLCNVNAKTNSRSDKIEIKVKAVEVYQRVKRFFRNIFK